MLRQLVKFRQKWNGTKQNLERMTQWKQHTHKVTHKVTTEVTHEVTHEVTRTHRITNFPPSTGIIRILNATVVFYLLRLMLLYNPSNDL